ncbi:neutral protease [Flavobacteriaceae bacterium UJ101]|nr:neutral protease [Flavobacteriaceae bacterium UJ101]
MDYFLQKKTLSVFFSIALIALGAQEKVETEVKPINPNFIKVSGKNYTISQSQNLLKESFKAQPQDEFRSFKTTRDELGYSHEKFQQYYKGVKVEFSTYTVHSRKGQIEKANGDFKLVQNFNVKPKLTNEEAFKKAILYTGAKNYMWEYPERAAEINHYQKPYGELVILPLPNNKKDEAKTRLAYKFDIFAADPISRGDLYIDAMTGEKLLYNPIIKHLGDFSHGKKWTEHTVHESEIVSVESFNNELLDINYVLTNQAETRYSGTQSIETRSTAGQFTLNDDIRKVYTRNAGNQNPEGFPYVTNYTEFTDNDNNWTTAEHSTNKDNAALDAHWGAEKTYDYFKTKHNRDSYDDAGAEIRSYVHVGTNYDNAFWNGEVMSYGDGSSNGAEGNGYFDALTSIDVAAHEIGHALCTSTANLVYQGEAGALNESFSDIWGAVVEHYAKGNGNDADPSDAIWLIGDEIDRRVGSEALRSMSNPKSLGYPDTYGGTNWQEVICGFPTQSNDYCGVHTNSSVFNHWFYILTEGKTGTNDLGNSYNVTGIGIEKAAKIAYRLETVYLSAYSIFSDARTFGVTAAEDLYGEGSPEVIATANAFYAIGVGSEYGDVNYCLSKGTSVADEFIQKVEIGDISHTSDGGNGYSDHTSVSTDVLKSQTYTITITPKWSGDAYEEAYGVWVDYNADGDFEDLGEEVFSKEISTDTPIVGTFTIPGSATTGETRMRIAMKYGELPTPCEVFDYGEVEDYTLNIISDSNIDTEAPTAPTPMSSSGVTTFSVDLGWGASTDNVGVEAYEVYQDDVLIGETSERTWNVTGLSGGTTYRFYVIARDASLNRSEKSPVATINTVPEYCDSKGNIVSYEWIDNVSMGGINNDSGASSYSDFTDQVMKVYMFGANRLNVSAGFSGPSYREYWKAWIDYDRDGSFEADEVVFEGDSRSTGNLYQDFTVPETVFGGKTRLRVSMKYGGAPTACGSFTYGEVEDYTVEFVNGSAGVAAFNESKSLGSNISNENSKDYISLYPNPVKAMLNIDLDTDRTINSSYRILSFTGQVVKVGKIDSRGINVADLPRGVYIVEINDGQKSITKKIMKQ